MLKSEVSITYELPLHFDAVKIKEIIMDGIPMMDYHVTYDDGTVWLHTEEPSDLFVLRSCIKEAINKEAARCL